MQSKYEKAIAIEELTLQHARATMVNMSAIINASGKKPRFLSNIKDYRSRLLRRRRISLLKISLSISQMMFSSQLHLIMATPIPKFPKGHKPGGVVGESEEIIITPSGNIFRPPINLTHLPPNSKIYEQKKNNSANNEAGE